MYSLIIKLTKLSVANLKFTRSFKWMVNQNFDCTTQSCCSHLQVCMEKSDNGMHALRTAYLLAQSSRQYKIRCYRKPSETFRSDSIDVVCVPIPNPSFSSYCGAYYSIFYRIIFYAYLIESYFTLQLIQVLTLFGIFLLSATNRINLLQVQLLEERRKLQKVAT